MVPHVTNVIKEYQDRLREMPYVPKTSYRRDSLGYSGDANKNFLTFLFSDQATGIQFLKDVGLILSKVQCNSSGRDMTWYADPNVLDGFRWLCRRMVAGTRCSGSRSIRHGLFFQGSNLTLQEVLYLTYEILRREPAKHIQHEHHFSDHTIVDWGTFCRQTLLEYLEGSSEKIGGPNKPLRSTRASSVGENTIGDTLLMASGCLAESDAGPVEHFLFPYPIESPTHWRTLSVLGSNPALRSSMIAGLRIGISSFRVTRTAP